MALGSSGGAFPTLCDIYRLHFGAVLGSGEQWMNWIHVRDVALFVTRALLDPDVSGPYNLVAPGNLRNRDFHRELAGYFPHQVPVPVPNFVLRSLLGEKSVLVAKGPKIVSARLAKMNFRFEFPTLESALGDLLGAKAGAPDGVPGNVND
jgi:NAD dependent epimerase/dehydratase family enzyme